MHRRKDRRKKVLELHERETLKARGQSDLRAKGLAEYFGEEEMFMGVVERVNKSDGDRGPSILISPLYIWRNSKWEYLGHVWLMTKIAEETLADSKHKIIKFTGTPYTYYASRRKEDGSKYGVRFAELLECVEYQSEYEGVPMETIKLSGGKKKRQRSSRNREIIRAYELGMLK